MPYLSNAPISPLQTVPAPPPESPEFAYENLSALTRLGRAFERGQLIYQQGKLGQQIRRYDDPVARKRIEELQSKIDSVGGDGPGFVGFLGSAAEVLGQMGESAANPRAPAATAAGAATFGTLGSLGGPLGTLGGATAGAGVGYISHTAMDSFEVNAGNSYIEQLEAGVDPQTAYWISTGVGVGSAALELGGLALVLKPFGKLISSFAGKAMTRPTVVQAAKNAAVAYGAAVAGETTAEVLQEALAIAGVEAGKLFTDEELPRLSEDEIIDRLAEVGVKTIQAMTVLAAPGVGASVISDIRSARQATKNRANLDAFKEQVDQLPPETAQEQVEIALSKAELKEVFIPAETLIELANKSGDPSRFYQSLGFTDGAMISQVEDAAILGGDVRFDERRFGNLVRGELYQTLADHVRFDRDSMTAAEAKEFEEAQAAALVVDTLEPESAVSDAAEDIIARTGREKTDELVNEAAAEILDRLAQGIAALPKGVLKTRAVRLQSLILSGNPEEITKALAELQTAVDLSDENAVNVSSALTKAVEGLSSAPIQIIAQLKYNTDNARQRYLDSLKGWQDLSIEQLNDRLQATDDPEAGEGFKLDEIEKQAIVDLLASKSHIPTPTIAEAEMGLQALFQTAADAGMTPKQYENYLVQLQRAADSRNTAKERRLLKQELGEIKEEIKLLREDAEAIARESVGNEPVYQALNGIGRERLDRAALVEILPDGEAQLELLPKINGRTIYTRKGEEGVDPQAYAELYGFDGADIMVFSILDSPAFEVAVKEEADRLFDERYYGTEQKRVELEQQIKDLHNDAQAAVLAMELNALRTAVKQKRVKPRLVKIAARDRLRDFALRDIKPKTFLAVERRMAKKAAQLLRKGDRAGAAQAKFQQLVNFQMALEAYKVRDRTKGQHKYFKGFLKRPKPKAALPIAYLNVIRKMLLGDPKNVVQFPGVRLKGKRQTLKEMVEELQVTEGVMLLIDKEVVETGGQKHYTDMTLREWEALYDAVKTVQHQGLEENKLLRAEEKRTRQEIVDGVVTNIQSNLKNRAGRIVETNPQKFREFGRDLRNTLFNADTFLREIDGFESLGAAYNSMKKPYDDAISRGYMPSQKGYVARMQKESKRLLSIYSVFNKKELLSMKKQFNIPGVRQRMSHQRVLSVLLNSGNLENRLALTESGQFSEAEITAIHEYASEKDWKFTQSVWDYLEEFWPEIKETVNRRQNIDPEKVEATPIETRFGSFRGGYYPLQYDARTSILLASARSENVQKLIEEQRFGQFTTMHTRHGHTLERQGSGKRAVKLDMFVLNSHIDQVVYDLEVGDAVIDIYKVLHHKDMKKAFQDQGRTDIWENLNLWFGDIVMGEMHYGEAVERAFRHLRTGFVVSKMGFNLMTIAMQTLGMLQSAPLIGKYNAIRGLLQTLMSVPGRRSVYRFVDEQSVFMQQRQATYNRELIEAQNVLKSNLIRRITPGNSAQVLASAAFYGLVKMQRVVDVATWLGAHRQGMQKFGDNAKAIEHADRMVARTQASGIFGERTQFERGTVGPKLRQSEVVRAFVPLISYFMAKTNVAYERIKTTNYKNPLQVIDLAVDLSLLFLVEALIVAAIRGEWPDDEDDLAGFVFRETIKSVGAGIPGVRDLISEAEGFRGGGIIGATLGEAQRFLQQTNQGELDAAAVKSALRLGGTLARVPGTSQMIRTGEAAYRNQQGEDIELMEFMLGPQWKD